ncbi:MAG: hypothetical protein ABFD59_07290, partial [Smithella sp.]
SGKEALRPGGINYRFSFPGALFSTGFFIRRNILNDHGRINPHGDKFYYCHLFNDYRQGR